MSVYLDQLIKSVQAEVAEERSHASSQRSPSKRTVNPLNRMLQRLATLEDLRKAERKYQNPSERFSRKVQ
jgi:hypothetical protein